MSALQKWNLPWSLAGTFALILSLVSIIHLFLYPLVPSSDYLKLWQAENSCLPVNGSIEGSEKLVPGKGLDEEIKDNSKEVPLPMLDWNARYPADGHNAVVYHGAPWKAAIGRWLSGCDSNVKEVEIVEVMLIGYKFTMMFRSIDD